MRRFLKPGFVVVASISVIVLATGGSLAQDQGNIVTVMVDGVRSDGGFVTGSLCDDPATPFCSTYVARTRPAAGRAELRFEDVASGRYALSTVHDENGNGRTEIPPEGFALGNNSASPAFEASSILVEGDVTTAVSMTYPGSPARMGSQGAPPPEGVTRVSVRDDGLYGQLYVPTDARGSLPAVILLDGSGGGLDGVSALAPAFAQHGYAALALAYFAELGLPQTLELVSLEYFDAAVAWLRTRPEIDGESIGVFGVSRGAEAALLLGARNPAIKAVVGIGPSGVVWQGYDYTDPVNSDAPFTVDGAPLPFLVPDISLYDPNGPTTPLFESALARIEPDSGAEIPVERINGPILLISGADDQVWPSAAMAEGIVTRLSQANFAHEVENVVYPGGHYVLTGNPNALPRVLEFFGRAFTERDD